MYSTSATGHSSTRLVPWIFSFLLCSMNNTVLPVLAKTGQLALPSQANWESGITLALNKRSWFSQVFNRERSWDRTLSQIYEEADLNHDGNVSFDECYERLLLFYITLNQQAPIPPPDRATVLQLYTESDWNHNRRLNCAEFKQLAQLLGRNAYTRLAAHKIVTLLIAPFLATAFIHVLATTPTLTAVRSTLSTANKQYLPSHLAETFESASFWKTVLMIFTVSQLGNTVLHIINSHLYKKAPKKKGKK